MDPSLAPESRSNRVYYIDNLRIFLTALVICHHIAIACGAPGGWYYRIPISAGAVTLAILCIFVAVNQAFFMSLFFYVAAVFTPASRDKKGIAAFLKDRLKRLGIPLLVYFFVLNPSVAYMAELFEGRTQQGYLGFILDIPIDCFGPGPLWFVLALLLFSFCYVGARSLAKDSLVPRTLRGMPGNLSILGFAIAIGLVTFVVRLWFPAGWNILGLQLGYFPLYIAFFTFGILSYRFSWLDGLSAKQASLWFRVALGLIALMPVLLALGGATDGTQRFMGGLSWQAYVYAAWEPFVCTGISMKLLVLFREHLNKSNRLTSVLSKSAYTTYIIHPLVVVPASCFVGLLPIPAMGMFIVISLVVVPFCFAASDVIRRLPVLNKIL